MAELIDLSPCTYLPVIADHILAVGWLETIGSFATGPTPTEVFERLSAFIRDPWQPFVAMGKHGCTLCQHTSEQQGSANPFIPCRSKIYVCPELITHYINAHYYQPPSVFCDAVLACPPMKSMEYKRALVACKGQVLWQT